MRYLILLIPNIGIVSITDIIDSFRSERLQEIAQLLNLSNFSTPIKTLSSALHIKIFEKLKSKFYSDDERYAQ